MAQTGNHQTSTQYETDREERNATILRQLRNGELKERVVVILLLGPTGSGKSNFIKLITGQNIPIGESLASGTIHTWCLLTKIGEQLFLFLDTPGFGHPDLGIQLVKSAIYAVLGNFTRCLGGIHGILYFHDITTVRTTHGMEECFKFLENLTGKYVHRITFITTKWDLVVPKQQAKCDRLESGLLEKWQKYRINEPKCSRYFRFGASCEDEEEEKIMAREQVITQLKDRYCGTEAWSLDMPFTEWTWGQQFLYGGAVITTPVWYPIKAFGEAVAEGRVSFSVSVGS